MAATLKLLLRFENPVPSLRISQAIWFALWMMVPLAARSQSCAPVSCDLVSWWKGDGDANDSSGPNNGSFVNGPSFGAGVVGQAFDFDGSTQYVEMSDSPSLNPQGSFTFEAWIYPRQDAEMAIIQKWGDTADYAGQRSYNFSTIPGRGLRLAISDEAHQNDRPFHLFDVTGVLTSNAWNHVAGVYDQSTGKRQLYANGVKVAERTDPPITVLASITPASIGVEENSPTSRLIYFNGLIDELSLYARALSAAEVQALYNGGSAGRCTGTAAPAFLVQPQSRAVSVGGTATFAAQGDCTVNAYQWHFNGGDLVGATDSSYVIASAQLADMGNYSVTVSSANGSALSSNAVLTVVPPTCAPGPSNLVGWWAGEGNANDNAGLNDGSFVNGAVFGAGLVGQAFDFDGTNRYVEIPNSPSLNPQGSFSFEGWIYPRRDAEMAIIQKWGDTGAYFNQRSYNFSTIPGRGLRFAIAASTNQGNASFQLFDVVGVLVSNAWNHVAAVYDQATGTRRLYANGVKVAERTDAPITVLSNGVPVSIGVEENAPNSRLIFFDGRIDELSAYSKALSASEVVALYTANFTGKCPMPPSFVSQPQGLTVKPGTNITFAAHAMGSNPFGYQWRLNGVALAGATSSSLTLSNVQPSQAGLYSLRITNALGSATSSNALLKVIVLTAFGNGQSLTNSQYTFGSSATIQLQNVYTNGDVFYTLNGSQPTFQSSFYTGPFTISNSVTLRALGYSADFFQYGELDPIAISIVPNYTLSVSTPGGGTVSVSPTNTPYPSGSVVTLTATPTAGWVFLQWLGDAAGTNPTNSVLMTRNKSAQALFGTTLSTTAAGGGSVVLNPSGGLYPYGTTVQVSAIPQPGKFFGLWGNAASGNLNPLSFLVTNANPTVSSLFAALNSNQAALAVIPIGHGQISLSPRSNAYAIGQNVTITATADAQQSFLGWSGDAAGSQNPLTVAMNQSKTIYANFTKNYRFSFQPLGGLGLSDGFRLNLVGEVGTAYRFEASSNFAAWTPLATLTNYSGTLEYIDAGASGFVRRFYRAVPVP